MKQCAIDAYNNFFKTVFLKNTVEKGPKTAKMVFC